MIWQFNADNYKKGVLSPAVDVFKKDGRLPDVFERYALSLDVSDVDEIETALRAVTSYWNKEKTNAKYTQILSMLLGDKEQREAKRTLLDAQARAALRAVVEEERRKRQETCFAGLDASIKVIASKGFVTGDECRALVARFVRDGLAEADILSRLHMKPREAAARLPTDEGLPKSIRTQIRANLGVLGKRDLYDFLGLPSGSGKTRIHERYRQLEAEWRVHGVDFLKTAAEALLGLVKTTLVDGDPAKYDIARTRDVLDQLRPDIELAASDKRITRDEFRQLVAMAVSYGLDEAMATDYVLAEAQELGASVEWVSGDESVLCAYCSAVLPRKGGKEKCTVCGADLWTTCPKCSTRLPASEKACGKCGFLVGELPRVRLLVRKAELALEDGRVADALETAKEAERLWGRQGDVAGLLQRIEARATHLDAIRTRVEEALTGRQLFAARATLGTILAEAAEHRFRDGKTAADVAREVDAQLNEVKALIERARESERQSRINEAIFAFQDALRIAADAQEARDGLLRCPPEPPCNVRSTLNEGHVFVEWSPSPAVGDVEYVVVSRDGRAPNSTEDGTVVARARTPNCLDPTARPGALAFYSVFAFRGGAFSRAATTSGLLVTREVNGLVLDAGDATVSGTWSHPTGAGRVRIYRKQGVAPSGPGDGTEVGLSGPMAFVDAKLENGRTYHYRILVEYQDAAGRAVPTQGMVASATPDRPPEPVEKLDISAREGLLRISWQPPRRGTVTIYRTEAQPKWGSGDVVAMAQLAELGAPLSSKSATAVEDRPPESGVVYYLPVTVVGGQAVIGRPRRYVSLSDVSVLEAHDFGNYLQLRWCWPRDCQLALVAWRSDSYPTDADDPRATKLRISKGEFEQKGGVRIDHPAAGPYYFAVFTSTRISGEDVYSAGLANGCQAELRTRAPVGISYEITRGVFRRNRGTIVLHCREAVASLPEVVLVAKRGDVQPLRADDGVAVATATGLTISAGGTVSSGFHLDSIDTPLYLRAFFRDPSAYQRFRLVDPPPSQLRVR